jgi:hypothetical protein
VIGKKERSIVTIKRRERERDGVGREREKPSDNRRREIVSKRESGDESVMDVTVIETRGCPFSF